MAVVKGAGISAVFSREIRRFNADPLYFFIMLGLPLLSFALLIFIFHVGIPRNIPVAVYDADNSALSRRLIRLINATPSMEVTRKVSDFQKGRDLLLSGTCNALIVLPHDLQHDVLKGIGPPVIDYYNNLYLLPASMISRDVHLVVSTVSAGMSMQSSLAKGMMPHQARASVAPVRMVTRVLFNPDMNYLFFLVSSLLPTMLQIFILINSVYCFGDELKRGTTRDWLEHAGGSVWKAVAGKVLPSTIVYLALGFTMNILLFKYMGAPLRGSAVIIGIALFLFIMAYQAIGLLLVIVFANMRFALSVAAFYSSTAFCFVGITYPVYAMPYLAKMWAGILPLTYYLKIAIDQSMRGAPAAQSLLSVGALLAFSMFFALPLFRLRTLMLQERYWGRI
ncbi:MAG: ABC transporter permease [Syntrophaceae bacterium]